MKAEPEAVKPPDLIATVQKLAGLVAPVTVVTSLLYYFGYVRQTTFCTYFGLDPVTAGYVTADYVIPSVGTMFRPFVKLLAVVGVAVAVHQALAPVVNRSPRWRLWTAGALLAVAGGLLVFGFSGARGQAVGPPILAPQAMVAGACLLEYAVSLAGPGRRGRRMSALWTSVLAAQKLRRGLLVAFALVGLFWATSDLAYVAGAVEAQRTENALPADVQVVVYSKQRLFLRGTGVSAESLTGSDAAYKFRYSGLRLLRHTHDRWLLLPAGWHPDSWQSVIILPDAPADLRVELMA